VPLVARWACDELRWDERERRLRATGSAGATLRRALDELSTAPDASRQQALARPGRAFAVLHAEATLPLQRAPYCYASEAERCGDEP
jgi:hypothetical protein